MRSRTLILVAALTLAACGRSTAQPPITPTVVAPSAVPTLAPSSTPLPLPTTPPAPLPTVTPAGPPTAVPTLAPGARPSAPIIFVDVRQQLSRVEPDGSVSELTSDTGNVLDFDVSPSDGSIVYMLLEGPAEMALVRVAPDGAGRIELARGYFRQPMFDPTGARVIFAVDVEGALAGETPLSMGIWSIPMDSGAPTQIVANTPPESDADGQLIPGLRNAPAAWSPDGTQLLLFTAPDFGPDLPAGDIGVVGLAVLDLDSGERIDLLPPGGDGRLCLVPVWGADSASVYCAAPYSVGDETPALFRIDVNDGNETELIPRVGAAGRAIAVQGVWIDSDSVTALITYRIDDLPDGATFERFSDNPATRTILTTADIVPDFSVPVLWAPDGSGAAFVVGGEQPALVWQTLDSDSAQLLVPGLIGRIRWGQ